MTGWFRKKSDKRKKRLEESKEDLDKRRQEEVHYREIYGDQDFRKFGVKQLKKMEENDARLAERHILIENILENELTAFLMRTKEDFDQGFMDEEDTEEYKQNFILGFITNTFFYPINNKELRRRLKESKDLLAEHKVEVKTTEKKADQSLRQISSSVRREVWRRDEGKCVRCGSRKNLEYDHIIPVSKGGSNTARNIELLCEECNRKKSNNIE